MAKVGSHHLVAFASRYSVPSSMKTLNAWVALYRAEELLGDAEALVELANSCESTAINFGYRFGTYEIVSYFAVGFITCLEWHARSRKVDLLRYKPENIETADIKFIEKDALIQMVAANVTIPYLVGAATKISSLNSYTEVFERVFKALQISSDPVDILKKIDGEPRATEIGASNRLFDILESLFQARHHLVHEIDLAIVGHFSIRDMWSPADAVRFGRAVVESIKAIESELTKRGPADLPNRLDEEGYPENETEKVRNDIAKLEEELSRHFGADTVFENGEVWEAALGASRESAAREIEFIQSAEFLSPIRHLDRREAIELEFLKSRLSYLSLLRKEWEAATGH